jgi:hypothetical protein
VLILLSSVEWSHLNSCHSGYSYFCFTDTFKSQSRCTLYLLHLGLFFFCDVSVFSLYILHELFKFVILHNFLNSLQCLFCSLPKADFHYGACILFSFCPISFVCLIYIYIYIYIYIFPPPLIRRLNLGKFLCNSGEKNFQSHDLP